MVDNLHSPYSQGSDFVTCEGWARQIVEKFAHDPANLKHGTIWTNSAEPFPTPQGYLI